MMQCHVGVVIQIPWSEVHTVALIDVSKSSGLSAQSLVVLLACQGRHTQLTFGSCQGELYYVNGDLNSKIILNCLNPNGYQVSV